MSKMLDRLTKFYRNEATNTPHTHIELFELAWDLANILEDEGPDSNAWKNGDDEEFENAVRDLRAKHTTSEYTILIDTTVNEMHQTLLDNQLEDTAPMMDYSDGDIAEYLLRRNDEEFWTGREQWIAEEDTKMAYLDELEAEFLSDMERTF
jgi:hypothetical protein